MGFRLEHRVGDEKPRHWEVSCRFCNAMAHFLLSRYPDFMDAADAADKLGWRCFKDARGYRYACPQCSGGDDDDL